MSGIAQAVVVALAPYVGEAVANLCVRGASGGLGKSPENLVDEDVPRFLEGIAGLLRPVASAEVIDSVMDEITAAVR